MFNEDQPTALKVKDIIYCVTNTAKYLQFWQRVHDDTICQKRKQRDSLQSTRNDC